MRARLYKWWCPRGHSVEPEHKLCPLCGHNRIERHAQVHASERSVVFYNPITGEHRTPARADTPIPEIYSSQGFERREILRMTDWEKQSGSVHEATNFNAGNELQEYTPTLPKRDPKVMDELAKDMADANASGPWTGGL